jgi:hypothetical protein
VPWPGHHGHGILKRGKMGFKKRILLLVMISVFGSVRAQASLGDDQSTVENDRKVYQAARHASKAFASYSVQEIATGSTTIREYVDENGKVFGIFWKGIAQPDLTQLLGNYLGDYQTANKRAVRQLGRRSSSKLTGDHMVIERFGHMRAVRGRVYLPALLPSGVTSNEIQ